MHAASLNDAPCVRHQPLGPGALRGRRPGDSGMLGREATDTRGVPDRVRRGACGRGGAFVQRGQRDGGVGRGGAVSEIEKRPITGSFRGAETWVNIQKATPVLDRATRAKGSRYCEPLRCWNRVQPPDAGRWSAAISMGDVAA